MKNIVLIVITLLILIPSTTGEIEIGGSNRDVDNVIDLVSVIPPVTNNTIGNVTGADYWDLLDTPADIDGADDLDWSSISNDDKLIYRTGGGDLESSDCEWTGTQLECPQIEVDNIQWDGYTFEVNNDANNMTIKYNLSVIDTIFARQFVGNGSQLTDVGGWVGIATSNLNMTEHNITNVDTISSAESINFKPSGDNDDYLRMLTSAGGFPEINFVEADGKITADRGNIDFVDENLVTTGKLRIGGTDSSALTIGTGVIDKDYIITFNTNTNDATITWKNTPEKEFWIPHKMRLDTEGDYGTLYPGGYGMFISRASENTGVNSWDVALGFTLTDDVATTNLAGIYGYIFPNGDTNHEQMIGTMGFIDGSGADYSGTTTTAIGNYGRVWAEGTYTDVAGVQSQVYHSGFGTCAITNAYLFRGDPDFGSAALDPTNLYGLHIPDLTNGQTIQAGVWIDGVSGATNDYGIVIDEDDIDGGAIWFGEGQDAKIGYDGNDLIVNPKVTGSGQLRVLGDLNVTGNITAENVFLPAEIRTANNKSQSVSVSNEWVNVTFDKKQTEIQRNIGHTWNDDTNTTITINDAGRYFIHYTFSFTDSNSNPDAHIGMRLRKTDNTAVNEVDTHRQAESVFNAHGFLTDFNAGDKFTVQFTSDDTTVSTYLHSTFESGSTVKFSMYKVGNIP